jgi:hypothetical protein
MDSSASESEFVITGRSASPARIAVSSAGNAPYKVEKIPAKSAARL